MFIFEKLPKLPQFETHEETRIARLLRSLLILMGSASLLILLSTLLIAAYDVIAVASNLAFFFAVCLSYFFLARGRVRLSSAILLSSIWFLITLDIYVFGGVDSVLFTLYVPVILLAGFLFTWRTGVEVALLSIAVGIVMLVLELRGLLPQPIQPALVQLFAIESAMLLAVAIFVYVARRNVDQALAEVRESESRVRTLIRFSPDVIVVADAETGRFTELNENATRMFGMSREELLKVGPVEVSPPFQPNGRSSAEMARDYLKKALEQHIAFEWVHRHADGHDFECEVQLVRYPWKGRQLVRGSITDITERKQAERALLQSQKLESLGMLAGGVAHDFNNLLVAMLGQTSLAMAKLPAEHPVANHIHKANKAAQRAADLTRQLLAYSGGGQLERARINLNELIQENIHLFRAAIPPNVELTAELTPHLPDIEGDSSQMQQVIMNLILNGVAAIGEKNGRVLITSQQQEVKSGSSRYWVGADAPLTPGHYVAIEVSDNGSGMTRETQSKIFDPFFTTKSTGRGLGLAAVLGIVRSHSGGIAVTSEVGKGTTFRVLFPLRQTAVSQLPEEPLLLPLSKQGVVLIIEGDEAVRTVARDFLRQNHINVIVAADQSQGIAHFRELGERTALVLLDLSLDGAETFRQLRQIRPTVPIVLTSAYSPAEANRRFGEVGLAGYLQKPFTFKTLQKAVVQAIAPLEL